MTTCRGCGPRSQPEREWGVLESVISRLAPPAPGPIAASHGPPSGEASALRAKDQRPGPHPPRSGPRRQALQGAPRPRVRPGAPPPSGKAPMRGRAQGAGLEARWPPTPPAPSLAPSDAPRSMHQPPHPDLEPHDGPIRHPLWAKWLLDALAAGLVAQVLIPQFVESSWTWRMRLVEWDWCGSALEATFRWLQCIAETGWRCTLALFLILRASRGDPYATYRVSPNGKP